MKPAVHAGLSASWPVRVRPLLLVTVGFWMVLLRLNRRNPR